VTAALLLAAPAQVGAPATRPETIVITRQARAVQPGELVVLTITTPQPASSLRTSAFGRDWPHFQVDPLTWRVLIGIDLDVAPGSHAVPVSATVGGVPASRSYALTVARKVFPTRRLTVPSQYVDPPPDVQARIAEEAALLASLWASSSSERLWDGSFVPPVPQTANSAFGSRSIFNGQARSPHGGADFPSPAGTPVVAPNGGRVVLARDLYFTGQTVVIDHGLGLVSLFAHLSRMDVADGASVAVGQTIGLVGSTGRVTGPHLHWTLRAGGARVDPLSLLALLGAGVRS
jgi:murein DD-endopeptidase MepM/ murein hydrolase activator NlpD